MPLPLTSPFLLALTSLALTVGLMFCLYPLATKLGYLDHPTARKNHSGSIPKSGGLAMLLAFYLLYFLFGEAHGGMVHFTVGITLFVITLGGILDDFFHWGPLKKFAIQIIAVVITVLHHDIQIAKLGPLFGGGDITLTTPWMEIFTVTSIVGLINAINMIDGIDGLAGTVALIHFIFLGFIAGVFGNPEVVDLCLIMSGISAGFLLFNLPTAPFHKKWRVFMGDAGSSFLGFMLAWVAIKLATEPSSHRIPAIAMVWVLALPLIDMARVMILRAISGKKMIEADHMHFHNFLKGDGYSVISINSIGSLLAVFSGFLALAFIKFNVADFTLFWAFMVVLMISILATRKRIK